MNQWEKAIINITESTKFIGGQNACNDPFLAMAYWELEKKHEAINCYNKAIDWIENNKNLRSSGYANFDYMYQIIEISMETVELIGIETNDLFKNGVLHKL